MRLGVILVLVTFCVGAFCQEYKPLTIEAIYGDTLYFREGRIEGTFLLKDDLNDGTWMIYHDSDKLRKAMSFVVQDGEINGLFLRWDELGNILEEGYYIMGKENGVWYSYYPGDDKFYSMIVLYNMGVQIKELEFEVEVGDFIDGKFLPYDGYKDNYAEYEK